MKPQHYYTTQCYKTSGIAHERRATCATPTLYTKTMHTYHMKGITPVIALILLLVITIVIVGFSFTIFQNIVSSGGAAVENTTTATVQELATCARLESVDTSTGAAAIRNCGETTVSVATLGLYANGTLIQLLTGGQIASGSIAVLYADFSGLASGTYTIRLITSSGMQTLIENVAIASGVLPPPSVTLLAPGTGAPFVAPVVVNFSCSADAAGNNVIRNVVLRIDGVIHTNASAAVLSASQRFETTETGDHQWNCHADDNDTQTPTGPGSERMLTITTPASQPNQKDATKYSTKEAFLIDDTDWRAVLGLVPVTTWTNAPVCVIDQE